MSVLDHIDIKVSFVNTLTGDLVDMSLSKDFELVDDNEPRIWYHDLGYIVDDPSAVVFVDEVIRFKPAGVRLWEGGVNPNYFEPPSLIQEFLIEGLYGGSAILKGVDGLYYISSVFMNFYIEDSCDTPQYNLHATSGVSVSKCLGQSFETLYPFLYSFISPDCSLMAIYDKEVLIAPYYNSWGIMYESYNTHFGRSPTPCGPKATFTNLGRITQFSPPDYLHHYYFWDGFDKFMIFFIGGSIQRSVAYYDFDPIERFSTGLASLLRNGCPVTYNTDMVNYHPNIISICSGFDEDGIFRTISFRVTGTNAYSFNINIISSKTGMDDLSYPKPLEFT